MLKFADYDIVFQEIPNEVTLAINLSNCPNHCVGCHSPYLCEDVGTELNESSLTSLLEKYANDITCVCFMGGDADPTSVARLATFLKQKYASLKIGWYSGKEQLPDCSLLKSIDYIKVGPYIEQFGPLNKTTTNQHLYQVLSPNNLQDITHLFWKK